MNTPKCNFLGFCIKINILLILINPFILSECNYTNAIMKNGNCINTCQKFEFYSGICTLENDIAKDQNFTSVIAYTDSNPDFITIGTSPNGNLISSATMWGKTLKYFYGLKKNGRPYFYSNNEETLFAQSDSDQGRTESNIFGIKLNGSNYDKEYIISFGKEDSNFELYDFENKDNQVYYQDGKEFFHTISNFCERGSIFKLKTEDDYYIIALMALNQTSNFYLMKLLFKSIDIANSSPIVDVNTIESVRDSMVSCFESEKYYIICFYHSLEDKYSTIIFDQDLNQLKNESIAKASSTFFFYKCVHFSREAGAFLYYESNIALAIQFKEYKNGEISDYFNSKSKIQINIDGFNYCVKLNDMIKIENSKFCFLSLSTDNVVMKIIILSNYSEEKIKIRYYLIQMKNYYLYSFANEFMLSLYNDMIALAGISAVDGESSYGSITIFCYPNSTDFIINLADNSNNITNPVIKFYEKCKIENNIFGHIFKGIQIINFSNGLKLIRDDNKKEISENTLIPNNTNVELFLTKEIANLQKNARMEYAMVLTEPEYEKYNQYTSNIDIDYCKENDEDNCDDEKNYFKRKSYIGRTSYCDIIINSEDFINDCDEHCIICTNNDKKECIICEYNYELSDNEKKKCLKQDQIISTESITESIKVGFISSEMMKSSKLEDISTEIKTMTSDMASLSIISSQSSELSSYSSELKIKLSDKTALTSIIMNNLTSPVSEIYSELRKSLLIGEDSSYYFNYTKQKIIKENILNINYTQENIIIREENFIIQLSKYEDQYNSDVSDISNIDLGDCENKLKNSKNIPLSQSLIIFKTDIRISEMLTTYVLYEVYNPLTLDKLNLSVCINDEISINIPVELNNDIKKLYHSLNASGYNLFDENDSFYQDVCATYTSENETDILLSDRKNDIYMEGQSQIICQKGCKLLSYDSNNNKARCDCSVSIEEIKEFNFQNLFKGNIAIENTFYEAITHSNFHVAKCYKLIFNFSRIIKNIGEILMIFVFLIFIILIIIYFIKGNGYIIKYINFVLKLQGHKYFLENHNINIKRNKSKAKSYSYKNISTLNKEKLKTNIKKEKSKKILILQFPPKKSHIKKNKCILKKPGANNIINNNIVVNFKINTKDSSKNLFSPKSLKNKNISKSKDVKKFSNKRLNKSLNNSSQLSIINKKEKDINFNEINYKLLNDSELNSLKYELAIQLDKRTFFAFYWSLTKRKQLILFTFFVSNDYNLFVLKLCLLLISFSLYFSMNGFFFNDKTMHKVYKDNGKYDLIYKIPQLIYSVISSTLIKTILRTLCLSENNILELKGKTNEYMEKSKKVLSNLKIKFNIFFIISILLMMLFWYYISCFCAVFINTQIILIKDSIFSFILSNFYVFGLNLITGLFRIYSLRKGKDKNILYKLSQFLAFL